MKVHIAMGISLSFTLLLETVEAKQGGSWAPGFDHPGAITWPATFEAINMAVIPLPGTGGLSNPGKIIVWDKEPDNNNIMPGLPWPQRFSVIAPEASTAPGTWWWNNYVVNIPAGFGDLFCSGHVWMPDGRLFVAGGNTLYPDQNHSPPWWNNFLGSKFAGIWDPTLVGSANYGWTFLQPMQLARWYPTVTLLGNNQIMVSGGVEDTNNQVWGPPSGPTDNAFDTFELFDISTSSWVLNSSIGGPLSGTYLYEGPAYARQYTANGNLSLFGEYPRQHLLSSGDLFVAGPWRGANRVHPTSFPILPSCNWLTNWPPPPSGPLPILDTGSFRSSGSSVLVPNVGRHPANKDMVMILGGNQGTTMSPLDSTNTVQVCNAFSGLGSSAWSPLFGPSQFPSLNFGRMVPNTVLLPDGAILVVGGCKGPDYFSVSNPTPEFRPEIYRKSVNAWVLQSPQVSERMYHSTAALLPSGKVVSAGGDIRDTDYEVFTPDYLALSQARPAFASTIGPYLTFATTYSIPYTPMPPGLHVDRVVLMRPCSVTHHSDMDQRYVELEQVIGGTTPPPNTIRVKTPPIPVPAGTSQDSVVAPPGWYMMFLISSTGTPSIAQWVRLA